MNEQERKEKKKICVPVKTTQQNPDWTAKYKPKQKKC